MTDILCPTRGGKESQPNQDFAIGLARLRGVDILFLYVSNIQLLSRAGPPIVVDIEEELDEVGDFLLSMARERAEKAGVKAEAAVRHGFFTKVLKEVILEKDIKTVVLGRSRQDATGLVSFEHLQDMSRNLSHEMGVEFIVVQDGRVVFQTGD